jgi:hypothetical protein
MRELFSESRNELIKKIIQTVELKQNEIAEIVEIFYDTQDLRIAHANKERTEPPSPLVEWLDFWLKIGERVIQNKLTQWIESDDAPPECKWAYEQIGIGPIIASGLAAHIDVAKARTISAVWRFAGLAPGFDRKVKGQKLPYNARLKVLAWKAGQSFVKVSGKEGATYGKLYAEFKGQEIKRNESGAYTEAAKNELARKKFKAEDSVTMKRLVAGKLSDAHLHARATRRTVKIFLAHYWTAGRTGRGLPVNGPYPIDILGHSGKIDLQP